MALVTSVRIDKWLWAVRIYKTRSEAADACKHNKVLINGNEVKPSREVRIGDIINVKKMPIVYSYKVLQLIQARQPAKNVSLYAENLTDPEEIEKIQMARTTIFVQRDRGTGRPTKKDRRVIDDLMDDFNQGDDTSDDE